MAETQGIKNMKAWNRARLPALPHLSDPEASPVCPLCGWYLDEGYHGCPDHGPVEPVYSSDSVQSEESPE